MNKFIELEDSAGNSVVLNTDYIIKVQPLEEGLSYITFMDKSTFNAKIDFKDFSGYLTK